MVDGVIIMKKYIIIISVILILLLGGYFMFNIFAPKINISSTSASLTYVYGSQNINTSLSTEEGELLKSIFNNKRLYSDNPSCGFTEEVSIRFENFVFCIACDDCPIVKFGNKYFKISTVDRKTIEKIFEKYGGSFPCI
jgi:hypothetical protein